MFPCRTGNTYLNTKIGGSAYTQLGDVYNVGDNSSLTKAERCHQVFKTSQYEYYKDMDPDRLPGTCKWAIEHDCFQAWQNGCRNDLLRISANPGCGKSVLSKSIIDHDLAETDKNMVCYFFFKHTKQQSLLATALCAVLHQLFSHQPQLLRHAVPAWEKNGDKLQQEINLM